MINWLRKIKRKLFPTKEALARTRLLELMPKNGTCAEVGAWKGEFSKMILEITKPDKLYIIDPYKFFGEYKNAWYGGKVGGQERMDAIYEDIQQQFASEITSGQLEIYRATSEEGIQRIEDNSLDWIYIDGNHMYEYVKKDLELAWDKVKSGGFVTGDDYGLEGWWEDGVKKAVDEFIDKMTEELDHVDINRTQFILKKKAK